MKKLMMFVLIGFGFIGSANAAYTVDSLAFAAKYQINSELFKDAEFIQGSYEDISNNKRLFTLYYSGVYQGRNSVMTLMCKVNKSKDELEFCMPISVNPR